MERTANKAQLSSGALTIHTLPTFVLFLSVLLTICLGGLTLSTLAGLRIGDTLLHPNPFATYEALWPGQSIESVAEVARRIPDASLSCDSWIGASKFHPNLTTPKAEKTADGRGREISCTSFPRDGMFSAMSVAIENGQVQVLHLVSEVLQQDALFLYWGAADVVKQGGSKQRWVLQWNRSGYQATALVQEAGSVVEDVTLLSKELPVGDDGLLPKS